MEESSYCSNLNQSGDPMLFISNARMAIAATGLVAAFATTAQADPIAGNWKRPNGIIVRFSPCGGAFCASPITGPNAGKSAGKLSAVGNGKYKGTLTDLEKNKTYTGKGSISGSTLTVSGCVLAILCRSENWIRQ
jgi:uncharacterized protein (DUF2147 family)